MTAPTVGTRLPEWTVECVSSEKMKTMAALLADPNRIHFDVVAVRAVGMGDRVVNQGPTNLAYVMNMLILWCGDVSRIRGLATRFQGNVLALDKVTAGGEITALNQTASGVEADCEVWLDVVGGERVISGTARVLLPETTNPAGR
jgi:acyl dehydratase